jgi:hypothetical protein
VQQKRTRPRTRPLLRKTISGSGSSLWGRIRDPLSGAAAPQPEGGPAGGGGPALSEGDLVTGEEASKGKQPSN